MPVRRGSSNWTCAVVRLSTPRSEGCRAPGAICNDARRAATCSPLAAVALSAVVGLTTACTSGDGADPSTIPAPSSTTTTPASPSPSRTGPLTTGPNVAPGEKPPVMSTVARQHTAAGALSFAQYYYRAFDWGYATNDPYLVQQISDQNCRACNRYITTLQALARAGGHVQNGRIRVKSARLTTGQFTVNSDYVADVMTDEEAVVCDLSVKRPQHG